jgi:hypothetical protein
VPSATTGDTPRQTARGRWSGRRLPTVEELPHAARRCSDEFSLDAQPANVLPEAEQATFQGYVRSDGTIATRNFLGILTTVNCSATAARQIANRMRYWACASWSAISKHSTGFRSSMSNQSSTRLPSGYASPLPHLRGQGDNCVPARECDHARWQKPGPGPGRSTAKGSGAPSTRTTLTSCRSGWATARRRWLSTNGKQLPGCRDLPGGTRGTRIPGVSFHLITGSSETMDEIRGNAVAAGGSVLREAAPSPWGGYFGDPDGHLRKVASAA